MVEKRECGYSQDNSFVQMFSKDIVVSVFLEQFFVRRFTCYMPVMIGHFSDLPFLTNKQ